MGIADRGRIELRVADAGGIGILRGTGCDVDPPDRGKPPGRKRVQHKDRQIDRGQCGRENHEA